MLLEYFLLNGVVFMSPIDEVLCLDGSRYRLHKYSSEEEVHDIVREHYADLFGACSIYFGFEPKLRSEAGIGSKPDGCVLIFSPSPCWIVVEVEMASHPLYDHVIPQISKFIKALENPQNRKYIADALFREVESDPFKRALLEKHGFGREIYKFLNDVISKKPSITIVIDEWSKELDEVLGVLPLKADVIELKTFEREGVGLSVHAHLIKLERKEVKKPAETPPGGEGVQMLNKIEVALSNSAIKYNLVYVQKSFRRLFPGYKVPFILETNVGEIETYITGGHATDKVGDPDVGHYFTKGLSKWYRHNDVKEGDTVIIEVIEPNKRYKLYKKTNTAS